MKEKSLIPAAKSTPTIYKTPTPVPRMPSYSKFHLYFQFITKIFFTVVVIFLLIVTISSISDDVKKEIEEIRNREEQKRESCRNKYNENKCYLKEEDLQPFLREYCWKKRQCFEEKLKFVSKTKITVKFIAQLINEFINPLSPKALVTIALVSAIVLWIPK